jgi:hypothetical protein
MEKLNTCFVFCLIILLVGCLNKPKFELIQQIQLDNELNKLLVYTYNDGSSTKIVSLDLKQGEVISEMKTEYADGSIYLLPSKFSSNLKNANFFEEIISTKKFGIWASSLDERYFYHSDDTYLFFNPQTLTVNLDGKEYKFSNILLENILANDLEGSVDPWVNRLILYKDKFTLLKTIFIDTNSKLKTKLLKQDINTGSVDSVLLDLEISDVVQNFSQDNRLIFHQNCKLYKYSSNQESPEYLFSLPESAETCTNISRIGPNEYIYIDYKIGALGYTKELKLYSVEKQSSRKLFSVRAEYGHEANISYSIFDKEN